LFEDPERFVYLGVDENPRYISTARSVYKMDFMVGDATTLNVGKHGGYDIVLINSLLHHLDDGQLHALLGTAREALADDGECLVMDMVYPAKKTFANILNRTLINLDRGSYCRPASDLDDRLSAHFRIVLKRRFDIRFAGMLLWDMRLYVCKLRG
jgi:ubiquinone/menaquinone biosynthesis C-methylase UbiE